ncbi:unnamed protein product [Zymoseptoria tritici ST99CH_1A5]|uniref:Uncharacterized protein n=2 Tax=Zymoseptoria tritici TaxID=1047171 RepID=A0A2H1G5U2_ZYMTR|nr:unnamed protein product [Zymoseptoria tritici ST99CH_1E4]SMY22823.1 unnamed protein product [Zymoseptoria tritici ST99CH_1A5]
MASYDTRDIRPRSSSNRYIPDDYINGNPASPRRNSPSFLMPEDQQSRPYRPPSPVQYSSSPSYKVPIDQLRPPNPDVQAVQSNSRPVDERPSHDRRASNASHRSSRSHVSQYRRSNDEPYRTESEREEYIKQLKRTESTRPTLGGSLWSMWRAMKKSLER